MRRALATLALLALALSACGSAEPAEREAPRETNAAATGEQPTATDDPCLEHAYDEEACLAKLNADTESADPEPFEFEYDVGDPLVNAHIADIAEFEGPEVAEAYVELYECDKAAWSPEYAEANELIMSGGGDASTEEYNRAVEITNGHVDAIEDCDRRFAARTGDVPSRPWNVEDLSGSP